MLKLRINITIVIKMKETSINNNHHSKKISVQKQVKASRKKISTSNKSKRQERKIQTTSQSQVKAKIVYWILS